jgi:hypothetical protein
MREGSQQCQFMHIKPQDQSIARGLLLHLSVMLDPSLFWLLLQFEVTYGKRLLLSCTHVGEQTWQVRCLADLFLLINPIQTQTTVYYLEQDTDFLLSQSQDFNEGVYLDVGVTWVNSVTFANAPAEAKLFQQLLWLVELQKPRQATPVARS